MTGAGAASVATASPTPAPPMRGALRGGDAAAQQAADASAPGTAASTESAAAEGSAAARTSRPGERGEDTAATPGQSFAQLLAQAPPAPPPAPAGKASTGDTGAEPAGTAPEHLLALLDGSWAGTPTAAHMSGAAAAAVTAQGPQTAPGLPAAAALAANAAAQTAPDTGPAVAAASTLPAPDADGAVASTLVSPALEAAATARDTSAGTQAGPAIEAAPTTGVAGTTPLATARPQAAPALPPLPMPADPGAGFDEGFGTRLVWMAEQRVGHAEIRLNPEHVGPISVRVQLDGEQVRAEFHSAHAEVRQAIEASLPRLRDLLGQHGLQLGQADVGQGQAGRDGSRPDGFATRREVADAGASGHEIEPTALRLRGLIDEYA